MHALGFSCPVESWDELPLSGSRGGSPGNPWDVAVLGYKFWDLARGEAVVNLPPDEDLKVKYDRYSFLGFALLEYCMSNREALTSVTIDALWAAHPSLDPARLTVMKHSRVSCVSKSLQRSSNLRLSAPPSLAPPTSSTASTSTRRPCRPPKHIVSL